MSGRVLILQELLRRLEYRQRGYLDTRLHEEEGAGDFLFSHLFEEQRKFVTDSSPQVAACCSRRAGKSFAIGALMVRVARSRKDALIAYICPTRGMAKKIMWKKILKKLNRDYNLKATANETDLVMRFPNGSEIMLLGADKESDIGKVRGIALDLAVLDEAQHYRPHIEAFIEEDLGPTLADYGGQLYITGTPKRMRSGYFYEITTGKAEGWSVHHWTLLDNAAYPPWAGRDDWREYAVQWRDQYWKSHGFDGSMPRVQREWGGQWVEDTSTLVYPYDAGINASQALPSGVTWTYGLGLDLGIMALVVAAWSPNDPKLYYVHAEKQKRRHDAIDWMGRRAVELREKWNVKKIVADCGALGTHIIDDLRTRYGLVVTRAEKQQKRAYQSTFASEMVRGIIQVLPGTDPLVTEWKELQQGEDGEEDPHGRKDCADAALYIWRESRHYKARPIDSALAEYNALPASRKLEVDMERHYIRRNQAKQRTNARIASVSRSALKGML